MDIKRLFIVTYLTRLIAYFKKAGLTIGLELYHKQKMHL